MRNLGDIAVGGPARLRAPVILTKTATRLFADVAATPFRPPTHDGLQGDGAVMGEIQGISNAGSPTVIRFVSPNRIILRRL